MPLHTMLHSNFVSVVSLLLGLIESRVEKRVEEGKKLTKMSILHFNWIYHVHHGKSIQN